MKSRHATDTDIPAIVELWKEFLDFHKARDPFFSRSDDGPENFGKFIAENLQNNDAIVCFTEDNGKVIAYILATILYYPPVFEIKRYGLINDVAVAMAYRRIGVGQHLFLMVKDWFVKKGIGRIEIEVSLVNETSISFWRKMNFRPYKEVQYLEL